MRNAPVVASLLTIIFAATAIAANNPIDSEINYWVQEALRHDEQIDAAKIAVSTEEGVVTLSGEVETLAARTYADMEAKKISGVVGVVNQITLNPSRRSDTDLRYIVRRRILNSTVIISEDIAVLSMNGEVTLSGVVDTWAQREEAGLLASEVRGVRAVKNALTILWETKRNDQEIEKDAVASLGRDVYLSGLPITASVKDGVITLTGSVGSAYERDRAENRMHSIYNVKDIDNDLKIKLGENRGVRIAKTYPSDGAMKLAVRAGLDQDSRVNASNIIVTVSFGHVILDGSVESHFEKRVAGSDAIDVVGVGTVTNNLLVASFF